eukprot:TRINITY_DN10974_c0_g1_i10.p2 TRINITY_DN10974_c0_g1~~TRINITY_DN10974_c0_g1_i10.p2  ORF type:complete len:146 (-),score=1.70 TRINITY_DN10974_c0_g1_i10:111-548(-)
MGLCMKRNMCLRVYTYTYVVKLYILSRIILTKVKLKYYFSNKELQYYFFPFALYVFMYGYIWGMQEMLFAFYTILQIKNILLGYNNIEQKQNSMQNVGVFFFLFFWGGIRNFFSSLADCINDLHKLLSSSQIFQSSFYQQQQFGI